MRMGDNRARDGLVAEGAAPSTSKLSASLHGFSCCALPPPLFSVPILYLYLYHTPGLLSSLF